MSNEIQKLFASFRVIGGQNFLIEPETICHLLFPIVFNILKIKIQPKLLYE